MTTIDPTTDLPYPPDAIHRILYLCPRVHVYNIPPLSSSKGYTAASWTANNNAAQIFTARLRLLETAIPLSTSSQTPTQTQEKLSVTLLLEDPSNGSLFAASPYTNPAAVQQALDSSRFFAITVVSGRRKAVLGLGFEDRAEAFDFSIALQDARRVLGFDPPSQAPGSGRGKEEKKEDVKRDWSLKEGETITVSLGARAGRRKTGETRNGAGSDENALFSIKPPPAHGAAGGGGGLPFLPPPPSASDVKKDRRRSRQSYEAFEPPREEPRQPQQSWQTQNAKDLGFDDGEFGEFQ
ncbi:DUF1681-domain-containing protein [Patellaria atrata CBS 101060]|uniref:DUF1681-domain-containing protein n=1 Tax=Patellaria atrata CBS 101060 TaxID=1346257 RepID=A0A9P4SA21_9PEZI|nr:DUF1681-domain-containing protein [Patellaria atrata CBS 101060]